MYRVGAGWTGMQTMRRLLEASLLPRTSWGWGFSLNLLHKSAQEKNKRPGKKMHVGGKKKNRFGPNKVVEGGRNVLEQSAQRWGLVCEAASICSEMLTGVISCRWNKGRECVGNPGALVRVPKKRQAFCIQMSSENKCSWQGHLWTPVTQDRHLFWRFGPSRRGPLCTELLLLLPLAERGSLLSQRETSSTREITTPQPNTQSHMYIVPEAFSALKASQFFFSLSNSY